MARPIPVLELTAPTQSEHDLQIECTSMFWRIMLPNVCWTAIDHAHSLNMQIGRNGRPIGFNEAAKRKARGVKAGIADYFFIARGRAYLLELKTVDGKLSDDQQEWLKTAIRAEAEVSICWTLDQVFRRVQAWGLIRNSARLL